MDAIETFLILMISLIAKDFYDVFIGSKIKKVFHKYKITVMPKGVKKGEKNE